MKPSDPYKSNEIPALVIGPERKPDHDHLVSDCTDLLKACHRIQKDAEKHAEYGPQAAKKAARKAARRYSGRMELLDRTDMSSLSDHRLISLLLELSDIYAQFYSVLRIR